MKLQRLFTHSLGNTEENSDGGRKLFQGFLDHIAEMRNRTRKANTQLGGPMDIAIVAGGEAGNSVKVIKNKASELYDQISTASSAVIEISANARRFNQQPRRKQRGMLFLLRRLHSGFNTF